MTTIIEPTSSPVLPPSSSTSPATNPPSSPLNRLGQSSMYPRDQISMYQQQAGLTPYQYSMVMQHPLPLQEIPVQQIMSTRPIINMPKVQKMEDRVEEFSEESSSSNPLPAGSAENSPATLGTSPSQPTSTKDSNSHEKANGTLNGTVQTSQTIVQNDKFAQGQQENIKPVKKTIALNPPATLYTAYEAEELTDDQVYRINNRQAPLDESKLSYVDEKTGQRVTRTTFQEFRFEKAFGYVLNIHLQTITSRENLAKNISYLSIDNASLLTDEAIFGLGTFCNPKVIILNSAFNVTDASFIGLCINCKRLEYLEITGHYTKLGRLANSSLRMLLDSPTLGPNLNEVVIRYQDVSSQAVLELSRARPALAIITSNIFPEAKELKAYLWIDGASRLH
ncbi:hypothetical protein ABW20_dc0109683 [Dactylellina cionopaga]|nr:hypothetical protein ABW20_dc0109683 [Dactylellina cionopaga]